MRGPRPAKRTGVGTGSRPFRSLPIVKEEPDAMARQYEDHKVKAQEQRDEDDHGVIVAGRDAHEREQPGKEQTGTNAPKGGRKPA